MRHGGCNSVIKNKDLRFRELQVFLLHTSPDLKTRTTNIPYQVKRYDGTPAAGSGCNSYM